MPGAQKRSGPKAAFKLLSAPKSTAVAGLTAGAVFLLGEG